MEGINNPRLVEKIERENLSRFISLTEGALGKDANLNDFSEVIVSLYLAESSIDTGDNQDLASFAFGQVITLLALVYLWLNREIRIQLGKEGYIEKVQQILINIIDAEQQRSGIDILNKFVADSSNRYMSKVVDGRTKRPELEDLEIGLIRAIRQHYSS